MADSKTTGRHAGQLDLHFYVAHPHALVRAVLAIVFGMGRIAAAPIAMKTHAPGEHLSNKERRK